MTSNILTDRVARPEEYLPSFSAPLPPAEITHCVFDLVVAVAAKGFVILTGQSGTGKSRAALQLGQGLDGLDAYDNGVRGSSYELVPVGADWTDARQLMGYVNPFGPQRKKQDAETTHLTYEIPDALRVILRAASPSARGVPCMLVLDEMNLSHVERYFSPFLSLIEANRASSGDASVPLLTADKMGLIAEVLQATEANSPEATAAQELVAEARGLPVPINLLVVGPVNVDETTYMFSPKVLDRAHVLEMQSVQPGTYFASDASIEGTMPIGLAFDLLCWAIECRGSGVFEKHPSKLFETAKEIAEGGNAIIDQIAEATQRLLDGAYTLLEPVGFGFGFRAINEVCAYLLCWVKARKLMNAGLESWPEALDRAFVQKVLPKIHGNRRQLGESLLAVGSFLAGHDETSNPPAKYRLGGGEAIGIKPEQRLTLPAGASMARSREKLRSMQTQLQATGYATFIR